MNEDSYLLKRGFCLYLNFLLILLNWLDVELERMQKRGCKLTAILKFYPKTGRKTVGKAAQSTGQYSCPTELNAEVLIKTKLRPFISIVMSDC